MAVLTGILIDLSQEEVKVDNTPAWIEDEEVIPNTTWTEYNDRFIDFTDTLDNNQPVSLPGTLLTGVLAPLYNSVFYNRILVEEVSSQSSAVDAGNVIGDQTFEIVVWNAYFTSKQLTDIIETNFDGLSLESITLPKTFDPLEEILLTLTVDNVGPSNINGQIDFDFLDAGDDRVVKITGSRLVLYPYAAMAPMTEELEWLTEIIEAYDGTEQRIAKRTSPRQRFSIKSHLSPEELTRAANLMYGWRQRRWGVPVWGEAQIVATINQDDTTITVDTTSSDYRVGELVAVWSDARNFDTIEITVIAAGQLTLQRGVLQDFTNAYVMPVRFARMIADPKRDSSGYNGVLTVKFEVLENVQLADGSYTQFNSLDVDEYEYMLMGEFNPYTYQHKNNIVDGKTGKVTIFDPWELSRVIKKRKLVFQNQSEVWAFRQWLHTRKGKQVPFYSPNFENELKLITTGLLSTVLEVTDDEQFSQTPDRTAVILYLRDGTTLLRDIDTITFLDPTVQVTVTSAINVDASEVNYISFLSPHRMASDTIAIKWLPNNVAECDISLLEIGL